MMWIKRYLGTFFFHCTKVQQFWSSFCKWLHQDFYLVYYSYILKESTTYYFPFKLYVYKQRLFRDSEVSQVFSES